MTEDLNDDWWDGATGPAAAQPEDDALDSRAEPPAADEGAARKRKSSDDTSAALDDDSAPKKTKKKVNKTLAKRKDELQARDTELSELVRSSAAGACTVLWDRFFIGAFAADAVPDAATLAALRVNASHVEFGLPDRTDARDLADVSRFVQTVCRPLLPRKPLKPGRVRNLVITGAAVRAVDLIRALQDIPTAGKIGKLFAKHLKLEEQQAFLAEQSCILAVGTPNRIAALIAKGALDLKNTAVVILDCTHRDAKLRTLFSEPSLKDDLRNLLQSHIFPLCQQGETKIALF